MANIMKLQYLYSLMSINLFTCNTKPTCTTSHSTSLIDNILTNSCCGILINDISDSFPIFILTKYYSIIHTEGLQ